MGAYFGIQLNDYRKQVDNYNKGLAELGKQQIVTGHKKPDYLDGVKVKICIAISLIFQNTRI